MREIDPIREPSEALLSAALRRLASAGDSKAPAEVERALLDRFHHHHRRRRDMRLIAATAIAACLIAVALLLNTQPVRDAHKSAKVVAQPGKGAPAEVLGRPSVAAGKALVHPSPAHPWAAQHARVVGEADGFVPLPSYDPATSSGELQVVRVELPESDLRMLGAPIAGYLSDQPVTVDFIADRDGTPYAVRLVQ
ncbi:MAG: hypothetical protein ACM3SW_19625 [Actinomycetota bacterium]